MGWAVLLPGMAISKVDVASKPKIDGSAAAHDTEQTYVINALTLIGSISNGMPCRSESDLPFPARGVWLRSRDPEISSVILFVLFLVATVLGLSLRCIFVFDIVLRSSRNVGQCPHGSS